MNPTGSAKPKLGVFQGRYTYDEIKVGSKTGETLMAFDEETLEYVVVKRPSPTQPNPDLRQASIADLEREERALRAPGIRGHPVACRLLNAGQAQERDGSYRYLVLARARGIDVPDLIRRYHDQGQPFPDTIYLSIMRQLLEVLASAHRAGVVYNDVKADHLFWDENAGRLTVIDWGNAQFLSEASEALPADDVFQCAELLYEFVTGSQHSRASLRDWEAAGRPPWEAYFFQQSVDPQLKQLLSKALHPEPKRRYVNAAEMAGDLEAYGSGRESQVLSMPVEARFVGAQISGEERAPRPTAEEIAISPEFTAQSQQLAGALQKGVVEAARLQPLQKALLQSAQTDAEKAQAAYFNSLAEAHASLSSGLLDEAVNHLRAAKGSPLRDRHWDRARDFYQTARALVSGDETAARQACERLTARYGDAARFLAECAQALPGLKSALELFVAQPEQAWPKLETLPPLLRYGVVGEVSACSRAAQSGLDCLRKGNGPRALELLGGARASAEGLPSFFDLPLSAAAQPLGKYIEDPQSIERRTPAVQPVVTGKRKVVRKRRIGALSPVRYQRFFVPLVVVLTVAAGIVLVASFAGFGNQGAPIANVVATYTIVPTATLAPVIPSRQPSATTAEQICNTITSAEGAGQWSVVAQQIASLITMAEPPVAACGDRDLGSIGAQAYFQLGLEAYRAGDYSSATQQWTAAKELHANTDPSLDVLMDCALARVDSTPERFQALVEKYGVQQVTANCGFDPSIYLAKNIDLLETMTVDGLSLFMPCGRTPCPGLFQVQAGQWRLGTFFENAELYLPLSESFQIESTGQAWKERLRGVALEFSITSSRPNSFPFESQVGLEMSPSDGGNPIRLLLTSKPGFSAFAGVTLAGGDKPSACEVAASGPFVIIDANGDFQRHVISAKWNVSGELQFFVDDQPVCVKPIPFPSPATAALYLSGRGASLNVSRLAVTLASP